MYEQTCWHPVADEASLGAAPLGVTLLGRAIVLWRDGDGAVRAFDDRCPHRGTRLSLGRVCEGKLECAYHGWRFDGDGQCVQVPAVPEFVPPPSHAATGHSVSIAYGLIWLRLSTEGEALPAAFEAEVDPRLRKLLVGPYEVATSAPRIVENFLDMAHFGFIHEGGLGDRAHTEVPAYQVSVDADGLRAFGCRAWQPRSQQSAQQGAWVDYEYRVPAPFTAVLNKLAQPQAAPGSTPAQSAECHDSYALFVCPVEPERSRVWFRMAVADAVSSDDELRAFQHRIFMQDQPVLESQRPRLLPISGAEVHCAADRMSTAYRRWLGELDVGFGVC